MTTDRRKAEIEKLRAQGRAAYLAGAKRSSGPKGTHDGLHWVTGWDYAAQDAGDALVFDHKSCTSRAIDLDAADWVAIKAAAGASKWMPPEYTRNDWVADVCRWLRDGPPT